MIKDWEGRPASKPKGGKMGDLGGEAQKGSRSPR